MVNKNHPVWTVYNKLRTARLNAKYYCRRLEQKERTNLIFEVILAASAPTSAIAGLWFWDSDYGRAAWQGFGVVAAFAALLKPLVSPARSIKEFEGVVVGYRALEFDLMEIKSLIEQKQKFDTTLQAEFRKALQREKALVGRNPETREKVAVKEECEAEVRMELPDNCFFTPENHDDRQETTPATAATLAQANAAAR